MPPGLHGVLNFGGGLENVNIHGFDTGVIVPPEAEVWAKGLNVKKNRVGVDNAGTFDGPDTQFD